MPIFRKDEMKATPDVARPHIKMIQYAGDLLKVGIVTYKKGDVPTPHYHLMTNNGYIFSLVNWQSYWKMRQQLRMLVI